MRNCGLLIGLTVLTLAGGDAVPKPDKPHRFDPKLTSLFPATARRGATFDAELRGTDLVGARLVAVEEAGMRAEVLTVTTDASEPDAKPGGTKNLVKVRISLASGSAAKKHSFRLVTAHGVSNRLILDVVDDPVASESSSSAVFREFPVVINGKVAHPGDTSPYSIEVAAGETLTFEATSYFDGFDPSITISERSGSWFDRDRVNAIASNDEPLSFPGLSKDPQLSRRFSKAGRYTVEVRSFEGHGGPDFVYSLHITKGSRPAPVLAPKVEPAWHERVFARALTSSRMSELAWRGGDSTPAQSIETYRAVPEGTMPVPAVTLPALIEGRIVKAGEAHVIRIKTDKAESLAIEVSTPEATLPRFNPVVRLMDSSNHEVTSDVYTKLNNNGLYMMKMIEAKTSFSLNAPGEYTLQVRDITTNGCGPDFAYRVLVRPQVAHVGQVRVLEDHLNLEAGATQPLNLVIEREEGFKEYITVQVEGLPAGVVALPALENTIEKPPLPNGGKLERYVAQEQRLSIVLSAASDAPVSERPVPLHLFIRVLRNGRLQEPIPIQEVPLMVVAGAKS